MYFLLSGEGPTDMGMCNDGAKSCEGNDHLEGPMAILVSQIVEHRLEFSFIDSGFYGYVSKSLLVETASILKQQKKSLRLPGKKKPKETRYFYNNARALALCAKKREAELDDEVVAVLFRDADGTASAGRGLWQDKRNSMLQGFADEQFQRGVPMIPKPKSEAWIICAVRSDAYRNCAEIEDRSGNDNAPNALKDELRGILGNATTRESLCELVENGTINFERMDMPSFQSFRQRLEQVI